jgi:hypothetical protein
MPTQPTSLGPIIDPPGPWAPEAEQRELLKHMLAMDQGAATVRDAVQTVRQQLKDRLWEGVSKETAR